MIVGLPRFGGAFAGGVPDAQEWTALFSWVSPSDGRSCPCWTITRGRVPGVRADIAINGRVGRCCQQEGRREEGCSVSGGV